jgi:hypothetical protein
MSAAAADETGEEVGRVARDFLALTEAAHRRRVAVRQGRREPDAAGCDHAAWDHARQWCDGCGVTRVELCLARQRGGAA